MIRSTWHMRKFEVVGTDGRVGSVDDFYFDDERWAIRYIVVDTGDWLPGRRALISPISVSRVVWDAQQVRLSISRDQVRDSPGIDAHLRSAAAVSGYGVRAIDGSLGHIDDFLFDDLSWAVRYLVVDTSDWWFGKHVLVAPQWIDDISWPDRAVSVDMSREALKGAPQYDRREHVDRQWEAAYYLHLRQPGYWLTSEEARFIKEAQSYLQEEPDRRDLAVERRARRR
jgi:hypothetical protein